MKMNRLWVLLLGFTCFALCGSSLAQEPQGISLPENSRLVWAVVGEGVQIYEVKANPANGCQWTLKKTWTSHDAKNIAWLLVAVKSRSGSGLLDKVDYVVRISTEGGVPPNELPKTEHETARVKYRAIYLFLQKAG
jgi:hypothetical protein